MDTTSILGINLKQPRKILIWQDKALEIAQKLNIPLSKSWFNFFKSAFTKKQEGYIEATYSCLMDLSKNINEKYFFKVFFNKLKRNLKKITL